MNELLEERLQRVLTAEADSGPSPSLTAADVTRLRRCPAPHRRRTAVTAGVAASASAAVVVAVLTVGGSTPAFASWTSRPSTGEATPSADGSCRQAMSGLAGGTPYRTHGTYGPPVIVDRRGHTAYSVFAHGDDWIGCIATVPGQTPDKGLGPGYVDFGRLARNVVTSTSAADPLVVLDAKSPEGSRPRDQATVTYVSGRVAPDVASVTIETSRGLIEASVVNGDFAAWWPGNDGDTAVVHAYDSSGALLTTVDKLNCAAVDGRNSPRVSTVGYAPTGGCR